MINSILESLIYNLFWIIHTRMSETHMFNFVNDSKGSLHLMKCRVWCHPRRCIAPSGSKYKQNCIGYYYYFDL